MNNNTPIKILLAPFSKPIPNGDKLIPSPKDYPHWENLVSELKRTGRYEFGQISVTGQPELKLVSRYHQNLTYRQMVELVQEYDTFISVDTFLPHIAHLLGKVGVVLWGMGNPKYFGYEDNLNIYKDEKYFREDKLTWMVWAYTQANENAWDKPCTVANKIKSRINSLIKHNRGEV